MKTSFFQQIQQCGLAGQPVSREDAGRILSVPNDCLSELLNAAFAVRQKYWQKNVSIHIINNVENGNCSEDCHYCAQSKNATTPIAAYAAKSDEEIYKEAEEAFASGAFRYCMVYSGQRQAQSRIDHICEIVREIKRRFPMEVCVSPGLITPKQAQQLKAAGLNRLNHNINTSAQYYHHICTSHKFQDRLNTLKAATDAGLNICSGVILGMGETGDDIIDMALQLRKYNAASIPVNFFIPIEGTQLPSPDYLTPEFCLRTLCLFRFLNPKAEIRVAAGREIYLKDKQTLAFYPANSLFLGGYLNTRGDLNLKTLLILKDAGFTLMGDHDLEKIIQRAKALSSKVIDKDPSQLKTIDDLKPAA